MQNTIIQLLTESFNELYQVEISIELSALQKTKKEFEGDFTFVVFPFLKQTRKSPDQLAAELGTKIMEKAPDFIHNYNVIKGFLNISIKDNYWIDSLIKEQNINNIIDTNCYVIEYSSPNTNKPLHLGHIRNNLLGSAIANILEANGKIVKRVNLVNDRGIHICKSMLAWQKFGNGETPENSQLKGDHLVGKYYVAFDKALKAEIASIVKNGISEEEAEKNSILMQDTREMLRKWEENDPEIRKLWETMNNWVYDGFNDTYKRLGISFDKIYYESETYLLGKKIVEEGLQTKAFYKREDGSVWVDLTDEGLDEKLLLRSDGTSVYMTQDLGTAQLRYDEFQPEKMIYVVGNEQNYHFDVLKIICEKKLKKPFGKAIEHLSYGMVELPFGKMKSREGTVVDADELMEEMVKEAQRTSEELGKFNFDSIEARDLYEMTGLGALKYFILKVDPKKNMLFNPEESIDFNGNTAPFMQYTHARICSVIRKATELNIDYEKVNLSAIAQIGTVEKELIKLLYEYPEALRLAGENLSPAIIANYAFELAKEFNRFYQEVTILKEENKEVRALRLLIAQNCAFTIKKSMSLLGINVPERM